MGWAIALHGGAGVIPRDLSQDTAQKVEETLKNILQQGVSAIKASRSALDVVELVVKELENCPLFNAGRGSVFTAGETIEMEACIMDGPTRNCGCVSGLTTVVNPISLARLVMEKTPHTYLAFDGAEAFAREQGVKLADPEYFKTEQRLQQLQDLKKMPSKTNFSNSVESPANGNQKFVGETVGCEVNEKDKKFVGETVGCVVVDKHGNCAAATSTGGRTNKMVGRIGDTPIVGAGTYANHLCAVSATGIGEYIIKATIGREVAAIMEYKGVSLSEAANEVVHKRVDAGTTGIIAVSSTGDLAMPFNTTGMYRAAADEKGHFEFGIWN